MRAALLLMLAVSAAAACRGDSDPGERGAAAPGAGLLPDHASSRALASSESLPARFGFGRAAMPEEIAALDIDVTPDGAGLPPGSGTPAQGAPIYAARCAACHGAAGEGVRGVGDVLVGRRDGDAFDFADAFPPEHAKTIGSYWPYAPTLFDYIRRAMPFDRPGSLSDAEVYALTAHLLHLNGIIPADGVMDAETLPQVQMPARDRFVRDDRETSARVR